MYQIAICDDEKIFTDKLAHMIKQYSNAHHHVIDLHLFRTKVYIIQIFLSALSCLSLLPLAALKHDTRHLIRHKTFYIHPHLACLFSNILYWSTSFSSLSLMFLFYHTFRT